MKKRTLFMIIIIGVLTAWSINEILEYRKSQDELRAETALIKERVKNVSKLVVIEASYAKVYTYENTANYGWDFFSSQKRAIIISNARASVAFDLKQLEYQVDEDRKILTITRIPDPELTIDPKLTFYQIENGLLNKFEARDINKIDRQIRTDLKRKIEQDVIMINAQDRLLSELSQVYVLTSAYGWMLQYDGTEVNSEKELKYLLDG